MTNKMCLSLNENRLRDCKKACKMAKYSRILTFIIFSLFYLNVQLVAQQNRSPLSLKEAWQIANENNLSLQQFNKTVKQAEKEVSIQKANYLPSIGASASFQYVSELATLDLPFQLPGMQPISFEVGVKEQYDAAVLLKQPIFTGFRTTNLIKAANQRYQSLGNQKESLEKQLYFRIGQLFYNLQLNLLQQDVLTKSVQRIGYQLERIRHLYHAQQSTAFDTLKVANRKLELNSKLIKLKNLYEILLKKFRHVLNQDSLSQIETLNFESLNLSLAELQVYLDQALQQRPELKQLASMKKSQSFRMKAIRSSFFPQIYANASYHYARPGVNFFQDEWMDYYTIGINLQWDIWHWGQKSRNVEKAALNVQQLDLKFQQMVQDIDQKITEAYQYLQTVREQIRLQKKLVAQEKERYQITRRKYEQGLATSLDLNDAEINLTQAELLLKKNYVEWSQHRLELDYATGLIGEE